MDNEYKRAARANAAARERGEVREVEPTRATPGFDLLAEKSELYEQPRGLRRFVFGIRRRPTIATALAAILPTAEEIREGG